MSLKIAGRLFTGPFPIEKARIRANKDPAVFVVISREGKPWDPVFRLVDVGETGDAGLTFATHPSRPSWGAAQGEIGLYFFEMPRSEHQAAARRLALVDEIKTLYDPPRGFVPISGF